MTDNTKRKITEQEYMQALALFTMSKTHYSKARAFELALIELLGYEDKEYGDCVSDAAGNDGDFDEALTRDGFTVLRPSPPKAARKK